LVDEIEMSSTSTIEELEEELEVRQGGTSLPSTSRGADAQRTSEPLTFKQRLQGLTVVDDPPLSAFIFLMEDLFNYVHLAHWLKERFDFDSDRETSTELLIHFWDTLDSELMYRLYTDLKNKLVPDRVEDVRATFDFMVKKSPDGAVFLRRIKGTVFSKHFAVTQYNIKVRSQLHLPVVHFQENTPFTELKELKQGDVVDLTVDLEGKVLVVHSISTPSNP
jgi:hypothetical protein